MSTIRHEVILFEQFVTNNMRFDLFATRIREAVEIVPLSAHVFFRDEKLVASWNENITEK